MRGRALVFSLVFTSFMAGVSPRIAHADDAKPEPGTKNEALRLKREGDAFMDSDKFAEALAQYTRAYELSGDTAILYNQARALEAMGEYSDALDKLERFEHDAKPALRARVPGLREHMLDLRGRLATLIVRTREPGARLVVRDRQVAGAIDREIRVRTRAGAATVEVIADGFEPFRRDVTLPSGGTLVVDAVLVSKSKDPIIVVRSRPPAEITIDGKAIGRAPLDMRLAPGSHELTASASGYVDETVGMQLSLGEKRNVDLDLRETPPITSRWWFWTGVAAVVVGGVVTVYALTTERSPSRGSFNPGSVGTP